jgi:hypothetical protein
MTIISVVILGGRPDTWHVATWQARDGSTAIRADVLEGGYNRSRGGLCSALNDTRSRDPAAIPGDVCI